ncbi:MAG: PHP domain-containing protein [Burkholderiaceae bacterium]|nr:PHP domain-containing protein [Burkholderiaceae bacterium]
MSAFQNADLHCHSVASDGTLTPEELAARAAGNGVDLWALTDHDEISSQRAARAAAHAHGMRYLTGVEISVTFTHETVHIVGLGFDLGNTALKEGVLRTRDGRGPRAQAMAQDLARVGIHGSYEGALKYAGNPELIARPHFARFLVETGVCSDVAEVFRKYLVQGKPGYVPHRWALLKDAVDWIRGAGGVAVLAHPGRYDLTANEEYALFLEFQAHGGQAIEVVTGCHAPAECVEYADKALEFGFAASRGSDFHSPRESRCDLGQLPALPAKLQPVWDLLQERIL